MPTKEQVVQDNRTMWRDLQLWKSGQRSFVRRPTPQRVIEADDEAGRETEVRARTISQIREDTHALFRELDEWQQGRIVQTPRNAIG